MKTSTAVAQPSTGIATRPEFWERFWQTAGIQSVVLFACAYFLYGYRPPLDASDDLLLTFYAGSRVRVLIASICGGLAVLNLMWFAATLRTTLADSGQGGWGAAATASSAALGAIVLLLFTVCAALAYAGAQSSAQVLRALNDATWAGLVVSSFPRAMLTMAAAFGLWRARLISNRMFALGVAAVVLLLIAGTTWAHGGFWAPDALYSRSIAPIEGALWLLMVSGVLLKRPPTARAAW